MKRKFTKAQLRRPVAVYSLDFITGDVFYRFFYKDRSVPKLCPDCETVACICLKQVDVYYLLSHIAKGN